MSRARIVFFGLLMALSLSQAKEQTTAWQKAKLHARQASDAFERTHRFLYGWLRYQSTTTSFVPQNILEQRYKWTIRNSAADLYPRLVLAGYFTDRPVLDQRLLLILNQEQKICNRLGVLPDDVYLDDGSFVYADIDTGRIIFGASEYCKDGLVMITEVMGRTPWFDRMKQLADAILDIASVQTPYGVIPADNTEVNGEMLMTLTRLYTMTGEEKYLKWAERIADVYLFHIMPKNNDLPAFAWDFAADTSLTPEFKVSDHGNEILGGLSLLYAVEKSLNLPKAEAYHAPLKKALDKLLDIATNADGLFYTKVNPKTGQPTSEILTDTWGYVYVAYLAFYQASGEKKYRKAIERVLNRVSDYRNYPWPGDVDGLADCLEGALYLLNRVPIGLAWDWLDDEVQRLFARQQDDGIITGVYNADNSFARVAMMYGRLKTQGTFIEPWAPEVAWGAEPEDDGLKIYMRTEADWSGRLHFDPPRHRTIIGLDKNYARLNEFQEWFTVDSAATYYVSGIGDSIFSVTGQALIDGLEISLKKGQELKITVSQNPAYGQAKIRKYYLYISKQDSITLYTRDVWSKEYLGPGRFVYNDSVYDNVLFRFRGHCYGRGGCDGKKPNKSFKIKFPKKNKFEGNIRNLDLNVIWQYSPEQGGVFRSKLPMDLFALAGYPAPKTRWCEFYLNGQYMGLFMEQQEVDSGPFLDDWFGNDDGNLYRFDKVTVDSAGHRRFWREINVEENVDWSDFNTFMQTIEIKEKDLFWAEIEKQLDIQRFLEHAALNMLVSVSDLYNYGRKQDWDTLRTHEVLENPMLYHDPFSDRFVLIPWDVNSSLKYPTLEVLPEPWTKEHILGYILANPTWRKQYKSIIRSYMRTIFAPENMAQLVDEMYDDVKEAMDRHNQRWQADYGYYDLEAERDEVKQFITERIRYIYARLNEDDRVGEPPLPFEIKWVIDPPLRNGADFKATTQWGYYQPYYLDRNYVFLYVNPILYGGVMLQTFNDLKQDSLVRKEDQERWTCTVTVDTPVVAYLLWDRRTLPYVPRWIEEGGWELTNEVQKTTDYSMQYFAIFRAYFRANEPIVLGHHQMGSSGPYVAQSMYVVIFVPLSSDEFPAAYKVWQNYPNPFTNETTIHYSVLDPGMVKLEIFNVLGQRVRTLVSQPKVAGVYDVTWDGLDNNGEEVSSGIYWLRFQTGINKPQIIKIIKLE